MSTLEILQKSHSCLLKSETSKKQKKSLFFCSNFFFYVYISCRVKATLCFELLNYFIDNWTTTVIQQKFTFQYFNYSTGFKYLLLIFNSNDSMLATWKHISWCRMCKNVYFDFYFLEKLRWEHKVHLGCLLQKTVEPCWRLTLLKQSFVHVYPNECF